MLRPERMSKVSVTGSRAVMGDVIETIHELNLVHLSDYDGSWDGFEPGDPVDGADDASEKLVTVRSLESILDIDDEDAGPSRIVTDEALDEELESVRTEVNELDDRRSDLEDELRDVEDRIDSMQPFADLGIDLDLLSGYDTLQVAVGEGDADEIHRTLVDADDISEFETFSGDGVVAIFAYPVEDAPGDALDEALVGANFASLDVPDASGSPDEYIEELEHERQKLESELDSVETELENVKLDTASFLLAAEEKLSIEVQKAEAPLNFATTENAFVAEGWIPTERYTDLASALGDAVGDRVEVDELERAAYEPRHGEGHGYVDEAEERAEEAEERDQESDQREEIAADGGTVTMDGDEPPVVQDNPGSIRPFEVLVEVINRPKYSEFDPTLFVFLTFPIFFGLMIADAGYGAVYMLVGYLLYSRSDNDAIAGLGAIAVWSGAVSLVFGVLAGEIFGLETITKVVWNGHPLMHKGVRPAFGEWAKLWLAVSVIFGLVHVNLGYVLDFFETLHHGVEEAVTESASWIFMTVGVWLWVFSVQAKGMKPGFLFTVFSGDPLSLGFAGFSPAVGTVGLAGFVVGFALLLYGEPIELAEVLQVLVNILSYTRLAAEVLAEAGIAFVVNLLFFGAYEEAGEFHLLVTEGPHHVKELGEASLMFPGLIHMGIVGVLFGLVVLVVGHLLVLGIGILSAGMQAVRLEYVEFFGKFYDGGGEEYDPFGYERTYTTED